MIKTFPNNYPIDNALRMHPDGVGIYWFYHKSNLTAEPLLYQKIVASARTYVEIWEPYFNIGANNSDQDILKLVNSDITIKILTVKSLAKNNTYIADIHNSIKQILPASLNLRLGIRVVDRGDSRDFGILFHDRFLIIDQSDVYVIGGSVGWHIKPIESTGILKVENDETKTFIRCLYDEYWKQAHRNELPIQFLHL